MKKILLIAVLFITGCSTPVEPDIPPLRLPKIDTVSVSIKTPQEKCISEGGEWVLNFRSVVKIINGELVKHTEPGCLYSIG